MEISSRQIVALSAPVIVMYLTWSVVSGTPARTAQLDAAASVSTAAAAKRPVVEKLSRDLFAEGAVSAAGSAAAAAPGRAGENHPLQLNGTVVAGKWRMAIIDGSRVFEGQRFRGFEVRSITRDGVTLVGPDAQVVRLSLDIAQPPPLAALAKTAPADAGKPAVRQGAEARPPQGGERPNGAMHGTESSTRAPGDAAPTRSPQGSLR